MAGKQTRNPALNKTQIKLNSGVHQLVPEKKKVKMAAITGTRTKTHKNKSTKLDTLQIWFYAI